jgi:hypothetical protein
LKAPFWLAPVVLAISPPLAYYAQNTRVWIKPPLALYVAAFAAGAIASAYAAAYLLGDRRKASALICVLLVLFFSYGPIHDLIGHDTVWEIGNGEHWPLLLTWALLAALGAAWVIRTGRDVERVTKFLTAVGGTLVVINLGLLSVHITQTWRVSASLPSRQPLAGSQSMSTRSGPLPDVYYIIVDRYPDTATLQQVFRYDNHEFLDFLTAKGFYVARQSRSNYLKTAWSLASSLNMDYINYLTRELGAQRTEWTHIYPLLEDYRVWHFLKDRGYRFVHIGSDFDPTRYNGNADENVNAFSPPRAYWELLNLTPLAGVGEEADIGVLDRERMRWERTRFEFEALGQMPQVKGPKFVFVHLIVPHPPYVFERDGSFLQPEVAADRSREENFRNQVIATNEQLKVAIESILNTSKVPPIILLQGDEGPFPVRYEQNQSGFEWQNATRGELREKTGILNAYHLPGVAKDQLYPSISPVNSFRLVFNLYFGTRFALLPDEVYAHVNDRRPYDYFSVTERLRDGRPRQSPVALRIPAAPPDEAPRPKPTR